MGAAVIAPASDNFIAPKGDLWVFGYGSLMWDPGFTVQSSRSALLYGYQRRFCVYSHKFRGTRKRPGLVMGLTPGGACRGTAHRIAAADVPHALEALWVREMSRNTYFPRMVRIHFARDTHGKQRTAQALVFVADPSHYAYAGKLTPEHTARIIAAAHGARGANADYLHNCVIQLREAGVVDRRLEWLNERVCQLRMK